MADRFTDARVPDPGVRALFTTQHRWQCWLEVEAALAAAEAGSSTMPHKRNPQLSDDCITIGAQLRTLVPLALEGMLHDHEVDGAHSAMLEDALQRASVLTGDLLARLEVIVSRLEVDLARMRANLALSGGTISLAARGPVTLSAVPGLDQMRPARATASTRWRWRRPRRGCCSVPAMPSPATRPRGGRCRPC